MLSQFQIKLQFANAFDKTFTKGKSKLTFDPRFNTNNTACTYGQGEIAYWLGCSVLVDLVPHNPDE